MATTTFYRIVALCDPYNSKFHIWRKAKVLKYAGTSPVKWVYDDNFGYGYTLDEAHKALDNLAWQVSNRCDNYCHQDASSIADLVNSLIEYEGISHREAEQAVSWYTDPGFYTSDGELLYAFGETGLEDDVMSYVIEECNVNYVIWDNDTDSTVGSAHSTEKSALSELKKLQKTEEFEDDYLEVRRVIL